LGFRTDAYQKFDTTEERGDQGRGVPAWLQAGSQFQKRKEKRKKRKAEPCFPQKKKRRGRKGGGNRRQPKGGKYRFFSRLRGKKEKKKKRIDSWRVEGGGKDVSRNGLPEISPGEGGKKGKEKKSTAQIPTAEGAGKRGGSEPLTYPYKRIIARGREKGGMTISPKKKKKNKNLGRGGEGREGGKKRQINPSGEWKKKRWFRVEFRHPTDLLKRKEKKRTWDWGKYLSSLGGGGEKIPD